MSPRRMYRRLRAPSPLDPETFVRRLAAKVGTEYGASLVERAIDVVGDGADPNPWIRAVIRARDAGSLGAAVARFLIYKFAESGITSAIYSDPRIGPITRRMDEVEREHGLTDDEAFHLDEAPDEYVELSREWSAAADAFMDDLFRRNGEPELTAAEFRDGDPLFEEGSRQIFGEREDAEEPKLD